MKLARKSQKILFASSRIHTVLCVTALVQARNLLIYKLINLASEGSRLYIAHFSGFVDCPDATPVPLFPLPVIPSEFRRATVQSEPLAREAPWHRVTVGAIDECHL